MSLRVSLKAQTQRLEAGTCTWYGACRFQGRDFMYQVRFNILDKLVRYDLLMTSFIACISGRLRRGRWMGSPEDRGDGLQHARHQVIQHQHQQVTRCHGVIATSFRSPDIFRGGIYSWHRKTCGEYHSVNNLILTMPLSRVCTNHH